MTTEDRVEILANRVASLIESGMKVGLGSGSTAEGFVRALGRRVSGDGLEIEAVATSSRTAELAHSTGIRLLELDDVDSLDIGVDGADEIDPELNLVKGRGGALLWEKLVARLCERYVIVSTTEKLVEQLGTRMPLPVEVIPMGWKQTAERIAALGCTPLLRMKKGTDRPFHTDGGHLILDCETGPIFDPASFGYVLKTITGVVDHGLFIDCADLAVVVSPDGGVREIARSIAAG